MAMRLHTSAVTLLVIAVQAIASTPDANKEVADVIQTNRRLFESLPMYTCLETISRLERSAKQRKPHALDTVQVDVGVGTNQEIYSWPGERLFLPKIWETWWAMASWEPGSLQAFPRISSRAILRS